MNDLNDLNDLHELLELATDRVDAPGRAAEALATARRRRTARRSVVATAAVVVVLVAGVDVAARIGDEATVEPAPAPATTPTTAPTAPAIARDRIQPVWDPRGAEGQPVVQLGVPRVMESLVPGVVSQPVAVLDDGSEARLVSAEGRVEELALPDGLGQWRTISLSPDGTRLAAVGISGFFWRALDGDWQRVDLDDHAEVTGEGIEVTWAPDSASVVLRSWLAGVGVDLDSGEQTRLPHLQDVSWGFAPDGTVVTTSLPGVQEWKAGEVVPITSLGPLENLQRPVISETSLAAARANTEWGPGRPADDYDGLIALDRKTLETRGFLRVPYEASYVDGGTLTPIAWLDDDTVLFTVLPKDAAKQYLMTWDVETGEVSRVSCWEQSFHAVFATELLG